jgi:hypothetical protein
MLKIETPYRPKERRQIVLCLEKEEKKEKIKWFWKGLDWWTNSSDTSYPTGYPKKIDVDTKYPNLRADMDFLEGLKSNKACSNNELAYNVTMWHTACRK